MSAFIIFYAQRAAITLTKDDAMLIDYDMLLAPDGNSELAILSIF